MIYQAVSIVSTKRSDLCDYSDTYIAVKWKIYHFVAAGNENYKEKKDIIIDTKLMMLMLMIMSQMVNHLSVKQKQKRKHQKYYHNLEIQET